jgi:hypothetical protein
LDSAPCLFLLMKNYMFRVPAVLLSSGKESTSSVGPLR